MTVSSRRGEHVGARGPSGCSTISVADSGHGLTVRAVLARRVGGSGDFGVFRGD